LLLAFSSPILSFLLCKKILFIFVRKKTFLELLSTLSSKKSHRYFYEFHLCKSYSLFLWLKLVGREIHRTWLLELSGHKICLSHDHCLHKGWLFLKIMFVLELTIKNYFPRDFGTKLKREKICHRNLPPYSLN